MYKNDLRSQVFNEHLWVIGGNGKIGRSKKPKGEARVRLEITFKEPLHKTPNGWSPGGAVFPDTVVLHADPENNTLHLVWPTIIQVFGHSIILYFGSIKIGMHQRVVKEVRTIF